MMNIIRKTALYLLRITAFDCRIKHHYTGQSFLLNTYIHKGYWYYGRKREIDSIQRFIEIIRPGMNVLEIGGHIGYFSVFFSSLTGSRGKVVVFEPGKNNLPYLKENINLCSFDNIELCELAAGNSNCSMTFYLDPITGQNNTLVKDFSGFEENKKFSDQPSSQYIADKVNVVRLDDFLINRPKPDFIKIDIEGFEWECIEGLRTTIEVSRPVLMIEIQANSGKIFDLFKGLKYKIFNDKMKELLTYEDFIDDSTPNIFFYP